MKWYMPVSETGTQGVLDNSLEYACLTANDKLEMSASSLNKFDYFTNLISGPNLCTLEAYHFGPCWRG